jgi:hypothetical protein
MATCASDVLTVVLLQREMGGRATTLQSQWFRV